MMVTKIFDGSPAALESLWWQDLITDDNFTEAQIQIQHFIETFSCTIRRTLYHSVLCLMNIEMIFTMYLQNVLFSRLSWLLSVLSAVLSVAVRSVLFEGLQLTKSVFTVHYILCVAPLMPVSVESSQLRHRVMLRPGITNIQTGNTRKNI